MIVPEEPAGARALDPGIIESLDLREPAIHREMAGAVGLTLSNGNPGANAAPQDRIQGGAAPDDAGVNSWITGDEITPRSRPAVVALAATPSADPLITLSTFGDPSGLPGGAAAMPRPDDAGGAGTALAPIPAVASPTPASDLPASMPADGGNSALSLVFEAPTARGPASPTPQVRNGGPIPGGGKAPKIRTTVTPDGVTQYSYEQVSPAPAMGVNPSNFDATALTDIFGLSFDDQVPVVGSVYSPGSPDNQYEEVSISFTVTTDVGHWDLHTPTTDGMSDSSESSVTLSGTAAELYDQLDDVQLVLPTDYQGEVTITLTASDTTVTVDDNGVVQSTGTAAEPDQPWTFWVDPYDQGQYEATLQDEKTEAGGAAPALTAFSSPPPPTAGMVTTAADPTGVRDAIDWSTLNPVDTITLNSKNDKGVVEYTETGMLWTVQTIKGNLIKLFEADPRDQQPPATQALENYQDGSYNCHGYCFGSTDIVYKDGTSHSFQLFDDQDAQAILNDAYTQITVNQAIDLKKQDRPLIFIFYKDGQPTHSAVNYSGQSLVTKGDKLSDFTVVSSKNGVQQFRPNTTIGRLNEVYPGSNIKIYVLKKYMQQ